MGLSASLDGHRVYVDANFIIYLVQGFDRYRKAIDEFRTALKKGSFIAVTSEFTLSEVLVRPLQRRDDAEAERYRSLLGESGAFELRPVTRTAFISVAEIRAGLGLKTPDAIHVSVAREAECTAFLSNDTRLRLPLDLMHIRPE